ncbi:MAG TPA: zinc ABC transporter substrate-binding protein [Nitrococcus sp.]|nr:zinc ABC transporter substrate-binding protein [Nitrococcus sp.]
MSELSAGTTASVQEAARALGSMQVRALSLICCLLALSTLFTTAVAAVPLRAFVSIAPEKTFVERVGGNRVQVTVMVRPGSEPETYEPTPRQIAALAGSDLYFRIGMPFEQSLMHRIRSLNPRLNVIDLRTGIPMRHFGAQHSGSAEHGTEDPHIWTNPRLVIVMAAHIRDALTRADPAGATEYTANYEAFAAQLRTLDSEIRNLLAGLSNRRFLVFHPAWGYFADEYGLQQIAIEAEGKPPGAAALARLIEHAKQENLHTIFVQRQFSTAAAEAVAHAIDARVIQVDPLAEDYAANLLHFARSLREALQ